jgi:hypothetical protein
METTKKQNGERVDQDRDIVQSRQWSIQKLLIEVFSIVLGVLLALAVNEWSEQRAHQTQAESALQNISNELNSNLEFLTLLHENNSAVIRAMSEEQDVKPDEERNLIPGLQVRETAWETLLSTGVSNYVEYETILMLSEAYSLQGIYKQTGMQLTEAAMNVAAYATVLGTEVDNQQFQNQFLAYFEILVTIEEELLKSYSRVIKHLDQIKK